MTRDKIKNILVIKPGAIGDLLQLTPVLRSLKRKYPEAFISLIVSSPATASLFKYNPNVDEAIVYDKKREHRSFPALFNLRRRLRGRKYDMVVNFQRSNLKAWFLASAAFPCRVLVYHNKGRVVHAVVNHLETLRPLGIGTSDLDLELFTGAEEEEYARKLFCEQQFIGEEMIALNPGASNRIKCWSTAKFAELGDRVAEELGAGVMIIGGKEDLDLAEEIRCRMHTPAVDLVGKLSLLQLGAVLKKCAVVVSGDTGPMHLSTAVKTPVVALFGAIDPDRTGPVGEGHTVIRHPEIPCVPCYEKNCVNEKVLECMEKITVDEVFRVVSEMVKEHRNKPVQCVTPDKSAEVDGDS